MKKINQILRLGLVAAGLFGTAQATAQMLAALPGPFFEARTVGHARPVLAWAGFCERLPRECEVDTTEPAVISLTVKTWQTIVSINRRVNTTIRPLTDQDHWGVPDSWDLPNDGAGDCEDYQLLKRKLLIETGLPRRALRMTVVIDEKREGHAVLMVRTDRGDFILDNKTNAVLPWNQTGYVFVKREGQEDSAWASLGGLGSPVTTANR
jgi:predicted transglutaminase-like cysteine proteinase